jgi:FkbM family methyltransferase
MNKSYIVSYDSKTDPRLGVKIKHLVSANDGDVANACVTEELIKGNHAAYCIDIGADEGWWSFFVASCNPNCKIEAFEPNPTSYQELLPHLENQSQITVNNFAISDSPGQLEFNFEKGQSHSRSKSDVYVTAITLDRFLINKTVDLIKIDTEGHDLKILNSLKPYLDNITSIIFECTVYWYGVDKMDCIKKTMDTLLFLKDKYKNMYVLSRRGQPCLESILFPGDILKFAHYCYNHKYQVDILVTNKTITSLKIK